MIWKDQLLAGTVSPETARRVGALLADVHRASAEDPAAPAAFGAVELLEQGRIEPYHRTAAARHPDLAAAIGAEILRLEHTRLALVLGDVSPKNIFVYPDRVMFFDVEIAHWGDPAFDVAFCLTHLIVKAIVLPHVGTQLLGAAAELWQTYARGVPAWPDHERHVLAELGCLLLARIDGKSPLEYVDGDATRDTVRGLAARLLLDPPASLADLLGGLRTTTAGSWVTA
jgi:5-methylthioribose kinase